MARGASGKDIRQLFERQGALVSRVLRVSIGATKLDKSLARGQFRQLDEDEIEALLHCAWKRWPVTPRLAGPSNARQGAVMDSGVGSDSGASEG